MHNICNVQVRIFLNISQSMLLDLFRCFSDTFLLKIIRVAIFFSKACFLSRFNTRVRRKQNV